MTKRPKGRSRQERRRQSPEATGVMLFHRGESAEAYYPRSLEIDPRRGEVQASLKRVRAAMEKRRRNR